VLNSNKLVFYAFIFCFNHFLWLFRSSGKKM
jgi:hypothetical protein